MKKYSSKYLNKCIQVLIATNIILFVIGCTPTIQVQAQAPEKPIEVNVDLNVKHQLDKKINNNKNLF